MAKQMKFVTQRICKHHRCQREFTIINPAQVYCKICCPSDIPNSYERLKYYSLSNPEFETMIQTQNYLCKICDEPLKTSGSCGLNIDHDHTTGKVRGIL
jgi:hypothetical protein